MSNNNNDINSNNINNFTILIFSIVTYIYSISLGSFILFKVWNWYIPNIFHNVHPISLTHAFPIYIIIRIINHQEINVFNDNIVNQNTQIFINITLPWLYFLTAWIIKLIVF